MGLVKMNSVGSPVERLGLKVVLGYMLGELGLGDGGVEETVTGTGTCFFGTRWPDAQ